MILRVTLVGSLLVGLGFAYATGLFELLGDPARMSDALAGLGSWGYLAFVLGFALSEPFGAPGILFILPAALVWPKWLAFVLSLVGSVGAGIVGFGFARYVARDWVERRLPARLRRYDERLAEHGLRTVIVVRLTLFLFPPAHWLLGLSRVRFAPFVIGSAIGFVPGVATLAFLGGGLVEWLLGQPPTIIALIVVSLLAPWVLRAVRQRRAAATEPDPL